MLGESVDRQAVSILQPLADGCGDRLVTTAKTR